MIENHTYCDIFKPNIQPRYHLRMLHDFEFLHTVACRSKYEKHFQQSWKKNGISSSVVSWAVTDIHGSLRQSAADKFLFEDLL
jgi:hypothetical protein